MSVRPNVVPARVGENRTTALSLGGRRGPRTLSVKDKVMGEALDESCPQQDAGRGRVEYSADNARRGRVRVVTARERSACVVSISISVAILGVS